MLREPKKMAGSSIPMRRRTRGEGARLQRIAILGYTKNFNRLLQKILRSIFCRRARRVFHPLPPSKQVSFFYASSEKSRSRPALFHPKFMMRVASSLLEKMFSALQCMKRLKRFDRTMKHFVSCFATVAGARAIL